MCVYLFRTCRNILRTPYLMYNGCGVVFISSFIYFITEYNSYFLVAELHLVSNDISYR